ncbi:MAG: ribosome small subunit-dependent GTPase A [Clostridia bacterium]|nr:ribosome small subunit-dependent GTPase A [Clostridia bacterium]
MTKKGILIKAISGFYYVSCDGNVYECKARGNFRKAGVSPVVGDMVEFSSLDNTHGIVEQIAPRKNLFNRPLVANIDKLFIVSAYSTPAPDTLMIDRLTALAVYNNIEPIIVFNKSDMGSFDEFYSIYTKSGFKTYVVSARENKGIDALKAEMQNSVCAFSGNSGVGKSSILNALFPELNLKTGEVSDKLGRGRHTTRHTELFFVGEGAYVVDTPGFSTVDTNEDLYQFKLSLAECFTDFNQFLGDCKFTTCSHTSEKGCAVIDAVKEGKIQKSRHDSYVALWSELKDITSWNTKQK